MVLTSYQPRRALTSGVSNDLRGLRVKAEVNKIVMECQEMYRQMSLEELLEEENQVLSSNFHLRREKPAKDLCAILFSEIERRLK
ncbi:MAG: hypothetical protein ACRD38_09515 [Nitrososphaerales archaeon]